MAIQREQVANKKQQKTKQTLLATVGILLLLVITGGVALFELSSFELSPQSEHNSARQLDMKVLSNAVTEYKKNNKGKIPTDGAYLIEHYITKTSYGHYSSSYSFVDPDGVDYTVSFVTLNSGETESLPNTSYTMYVLSNAVCDSSASKAEYSNNKNNLVVIYHPNRSNTMCLNIEE